MFSDESSFTLVRGVPKMVPRPSSASRYNPKLTIKTMKDPGSIIVWGVFSENLGQAGLYSLLKTYQ